jgi:porin
MATQALWRVNPQEGKGLDPTVGYDWSPTDINRNNKQLTAGLHFNEPIPLHIHNAGALAERAVECSVLLDVAPMLPLQPVVQYKG